MGGSQTKSDSGKLFVLIQIRRGSFLSSQSSALRVAVCPQVQLANERGGDRETFVDCNKRRGEIWRSGGGGNNHVLSRREAVAALPA